MDSRRARQEIFYAVYKGTFYPINKEIDYESRLMSVTYRAIRGMRGPIIRGFSSRRRFCAVTRIRMRGLKGLKEIAMRVSRGTDTPSDFRASESNEEKQNM